jgi:hypothetical protein
MMCTNKASVEAVCIDLVQLASAMAETIGD